MVREAKEKQFQRWLRGELDAVGVWHSSVEYGLGGDDGFPDMLWDSHKRWPVELKVGELKNGRLVPRDIRPAQTSWHHQMKRAGGNSFFLIGVEVSGGWRMFVTVIEYIDRRGIAIDGAALERSSVVSILELFEEFEQ